MDLGAIQTGLESWLNLTAVDVSQDPPVALPVEWGRQPSQVRTDPYVLAFPGPIVKLGHDLPQYEYDDLLDTYVERMWGVRRMVVRLSFRTFDQTWDQNARQYAEDWRIRSQSTRSTAALSEIGLALRDTGELVDIDYEWSGRLVSQVNVSLDLGVWAYERTARTDEGYIQHVNMDWQWYVIDENGAPVES